VVVVGVIVCFLIGWFVNSIKYAVTSPIFSQYLMVFLSICLVILILYPFINRRVKKAETNTYEETEGLRKAKETEERLQKEYDKKVQAELDKVLQKDHNL